MTAFSTYNKLMEIYLANTSETFFDVEMKIEAVNDATTMVVRNYDLPQMTKSATVAVVNGKIEIPTDNLRLLKIFTVNNGVQNAEFLYVDNDQFDKLANTNSYFYTVQYDETDGERKIFILPASTTEIKVRYIKEPDLILNEAGDNGVDDFYKQPIALTAVSTLLENAGRYEEAQYYANKAKIKMRECVRKGLGDGGRPQVMRFKSRYEDVTYLN